MPHTSLRSRAGQRGRVRLPAPSAPAPGPLAPPSLEPRRPPSSAVPIARGAPSRLALHRLPSRDTSGPPCAGPSLAPPPAAAWCAAASPPPASCLWLQPTCRPAFGLSSGSSFCFVSPSLLVTHPIEAAIISLLPPTPSFISSSDRDFAFASFARPVSLWRLRLSRWHHAVSRARRPLGLGLLPTSHTPSISRTDCGSLRIASWAHALLSVPTWVAPVHVRPLHPQECGSGP